jgi:hypothetical protein
MLKVKLNDGQLNCKQLSKNKSGPRRVATHIEKRGAGRGRARGEMAGRGYNLKAVVHNLQCD